MGKLERVAGNTLGNFTHLERQTTETLYLGQSECGWIIARSATWRQRSGTRLLDLYDEWLTEEV